MKIHKLTASLAWLSSGPARLDRSMHSLLKEELDLMRADLDFLEAIDVDETMLFAAVLMRVSALEYRTLRLKLPHFPGGTDTGVTPL